MTVFVGFVGNSGSGKTTLIEKLIRIFSDEGYRVGAIKHDAHKFEIDYPGKDSYRMKHAGARKVILASKDKLAIVEDLDREKTINELESFFDGFDLVFVEGYKLANLKKIEVHRREVSNEYLIEKGIDNIVMIVTDDSSISSEVNVPIVDLNDVETVYDFIKSMIKNRN